MLTRPVENIDDLKKLVYICKEVKNLEIPLDPKEELEKQLVKELSGRPLDRFIPGILARVEAMREAEATEAPKPEDNAKTAC